MGFFRKRVILKLGVISFAGYLLLSATGNCSFFRGVDRRARDGKSIFTENAIDGDDGSRSILIPDEEECAEKPVKKTKSTPSGKPAAAKSASAPIRGDIGNADAQTRRYIERFHDIAIAEMHRYGVPASISLAQGLIESRAGSSKLAVRQTTTISASNVLQEIVEKAIVQTIQTTLTKTSSAIYKTAWEGARTVHDFFGSLCEVKEIWP